jgi:hypothetical protein
MSPSRMTMVTSRPRIAVNCSSFIMRAPALGKGRHRGLARGLIAVCRSAYVAVVTARPVVVAVADLPHLGVVCSPLVAHGLTPEARTECILSTACTRSG